MPRRAPKPCTKAGCTKYASQGGRCEDHKREAWQHESRRESSHSRGYGSKWRKIREQAMKRDNWLCQACLKKGTVRQAKECDHITPKHLGGTDDIGNLQALCPSCHKGKTQRESKESRSLIG